MAHWYTADTHFGHGNIISHCNRPFGGVPEMTEALLANMHRVVGAEDDLWIIGDFAFGKESRAPGFLADVFARLPGARRHLIIGNHDNRETRDLPWDSMAKLAEVKDGPDGLKHTLCHFPMITWNHARRGALHLFGHVHENWLGTRNAVNVGVDVWDFTPVSLEQITARAATLPENAHWRDAEPEGRNV